MPSRAQSVTLVFTAWDTSANVGKAGDAANFTLRWIKDGTSSAPTNAATEVDATNAKGEYKLTLTAAECTCDFGKLAGVSATAGVSIIPIAVTFEQLPTAAPNATGGLPVLSAGSALNYTVSTVTTYTGNTPQTGDNFARLGAPAGASIAADIATRSTFAGGAVASVTAAVTVGTNNDKTGYGLSVAPPTAIQIRTDLDANSTKLANLDAAISSRSTFAGGPVASVTAPVTVGTNNDKTGYSLAPNGLDSVSSAEAAGVPANLREWLWWLIRRERKASLTATQLRVLKDDGSTQTTQAVSDDGTTTTVGAPT